MLAMLEDFLPKYAASMEWVEVFITLAKKTLMGKMNSEVAKIQKEFDINSKTILRQWMQDIQDGNEPKQTSNFTQERLSIDTKQKQYFVEPETEDDEEHKDTRLSGKFERSRKDTRLSQDLRALVNSHMQDYQVRLYYEIEVQILQNKDHPVRVLITECFNEAFMSHYK